MARDARSDVVLLQLFRRHYRTMADDDSSDRPTLPPPRPSTRRLFAAPAESRRLDAEQTLVLGALRDGVTSLIERYFDGARPVAHRALLRAVLAEHDEGVTRGRAQAAVVYLGYLDAMRDYLTLCAADHRIEFDPEWRPTLAELHPKIVVQGFPLSVQELERLCQDLQVPLAP